MTKFHTEEIIKILENDCSLKEKRLALLEDTIQYYAQGAFTEHCRRSVIMDGESIYGERCKYISKNRYGSKNACAIGRFLSPSDHKSFTDDPALNGARIGVLYSQEYLPDYLSNLGLDYLRTIQDLHDIAVNWKEKGLSAKGINYSNEIRTRFALED